MFKGLLIVVVVLFLHASASLDYAQINPSKNPDTKLNEVAETQDDVSKILNEARDRFKEGLVTYRDSNKSAAGEKFNQSVEVLLYSKRTIRDDPKLLGCYNQLIETIYRIEFPTGTQLPQIKNLAQVCNWNIDTELTERVTNLIAASVKKQVVDSAKTTVENRGSESTKVGFNSQEFMPSPLDELAKLELTPEEQQIESNPLTKQQYQYIQVPKALESKSLGFAFQIHPMIQQFINYYRGAGKKTMEVGLYRSGMFMRMARRIFKEEGVPENIAWLGQVESGWKPSQKRGLWNLSPSVSSRFGLNLNKYVSEVNSFEEATRAAARYLKFLANRYGGNWELGIAAYNSSEDAVDKAIRSAGVSNFWLAYKYLPKENRDAVPNILATLLIANNPEQYDFGYIRPTAPLVYDRVRMPGSSKLGVIAKASDTTVEYLRYLNPHLRGDITPPLPYIINVPSGKANEVVAVFHKIPLSKSGDLKNITYGETWETISSRTGISVADLMAANSGLKTPKGKVFIPVPDSIIYTRPNVSANTSPGPKPAQSKDGNVAVVMNYFNEVLHDPYSMRIVRWGPLYETSYGGLPVWGIRVKYRAKNLMGAYVLSEAIFYIRNSKVISTLKLD